jgi:alkylated DNA nucleotide flippase Atl1
MAASPAYARMRVGLHARLEALARGQVVRLDALAAALNIPSRHAASILARIGPEEEAIRPWWRVIPAAGRFPATAARSSRQQVQIDLLAQDGVAISPEGIIDGLEMRLVTPDMRDAGRIWLEPDGTP